MLDHRVRAGWVAGFAGLSALAGFTAHATIAARNADTWPESSFPAAGGAVAAAASPARGTTGTLPLPALPPAARISRGLDPVAAQPFHLRGSAVDRSRALQCLTSAIYYEAASEPDAGQRAVAQVVLNRARHPAFPATVCGVVFQGSDKQGCQFSFACDGSMARAPLRRAWDRAQRVAAAALNGQVFAPVGLATHYHTYAVTPAWNRSLVMTDVQGAHFFHRWKGWWGTAAAFQDRYVGNEPTPAPLRTLPAPVRSAMIDAVPAAESVPVAPAAIAQPLPRPAPDPRFQPAYADSGAMRDSTDADAQVLDKWKDSGKPIR